jgi:acetylornithine/N-succinyldiaminopimelate aminotransferase
VAHAVIRYLLDNDISTHVSELGQQALEYLVGWQALFPGIVAKVRGKGLLLLLEFKDDETAAGVTEECLRRRLFVRQTHGTGIRLFPALNIGEAQLQEGLAILYQAIAQVASC